jgi:hypothetical protein
VESHPEELAQGLLCENHQGRTLVFCVTKLRSVALADALRTKIRSATIMQLDSDSDPSHRKNVLQLLTSPERKGDLIVVCTKLLAEGVDVVGINRIIIVGGAHAGLTDVVQMIGRGGRGINAADVEVFLLHCEPYVLRVCYGGERKVLMASDDSNAKVFSGEDRLAAVPLVTRGGLAKLFEQDAGMICGRVAIRKAFESIGLQQLKGLPWSNDCGSCNRCLNENWRLSSLVSAYLAKRVMTAAPIEKTEVSRGYKDAKSLPAELGNSRDVQKRVTSFLIMLGKRCVVCKKGVHFPNQCTKLIEKCFSKPKVPVNRCLQCFSSGHSVHDFNAAVKKVQVESGNKGINQIELRRKNQLLNSCSFVYKEHVSYALFKPCTICWLQHDGHEGLGKCFTEAFSVRAALLYVWYCDSLRRSFIELTVQTGYLAQTRALLSWSDFLKWSVYEGDANLQNAYRVLDFVQKLEKN